MSDALADPAAVPRARRPTTSGRTAMQPALTAEEEATLEASLRSLGYLE